MKWFLALRYAFSSSSGHRSRVVRIMLTSAFSLTVVAIVLSVMSYLQASRFDAIRDVRSFDAVVSGSFENEIEALLPGLDAFVYAEGEALSGDRAFLVRYISSDYDGGIRYLFGDSSSLLIPYSLYLEDGFQEQSIVMLREASSGRVVPRTATYGVSGVYSTMLGFEFDDTMLFLPLSEADGAVEFKTAIKGISDEDVSLLDGNGYDVVTWKESESSLYSAFMIESVMMYVVLSLLFIIIGVSTKQSVRIFYKGKRKERFELFILGLRTKSVENIFMASFLIVTVLAILLSCVLTLIALPLFEIASPSLLRVEVELSFPFLGFAFFSLILLLFTICFSFYERHKDRCLDLLEVVHER